MIKKTWVRVVIGGIIIAALLIVLDEQFHLFSGKKDESAIYNGPVSMEKEKTYFTKVAFTEMKYDFGKVKEGDTLMHIFKFTNKGDEPLFIYKSSKSCDCLVAKYPPDMVKPGESSEVHIYFATKGRKGPQTRTVTITCNTDPADIPLVLQADVQ